MEEAKTNEKEDQKEEVDYDVKYGDIFKKKNMLNAFQDWKKML